MVGNKAPRYFVIRLLILAPFVFVSGARAQGPVWLSAIETEQDLDSITVEDTSRPDLLRTGKYLAPAHDDPSLLPTVYQNVDRYPLHLEFMVKEFPEHFGGLSQSEYVDLVAHRASRQYFAGAFFRFRDSHGGFVYGFDIYTDPDEPAEPDEVLSVYERLSTSMAMRPFAYSPMTPLDIERAREWSNPGFPVYLPGGLVVPTYEVYSRAENYGRVRRFTLDTFQQAMDEGRIGWQDIVVIDIAPSDIETVVAGVITGSPQGELSHVNVRSLRRGTPNAYLKDALQVFAPYDGQLVKLSLAGDAYKITAPVDLAEAEAWWDAHRPLLPPLPQPNDTFEDIVALPDLATMPDARWLVTRFGGKATGLALLYSFLEETYHVDGFAIPFGYYVEFIRSNTIPDPRDRTNTISYEAYLNLLLEDPRFRIDTAYRRNSLENFKDYARSHGSVDSKLVERIVARISEVFGSPLVKVRFRSSSNAEDHVAFNGAGLYDSTSVCAEDTLDGDNLGPSRCDPENLTERTIERGLKKVWMSLWNPRAFEEREYFQIDHRNVRMGILVTRAYPHEDSNGVAFSGDPVAGHKDYYVINVQKGDESVVQPGTGVIPEKDLLYVTDGHVKDIRRARGSSLLPAGEWVLTETQLRQLGEVLYKIDLNLPVDCRGYDRDRIYLDVEFKYDQGSLVVKQVRPTLMASASLPTQENYLTLRVPEGTRVVGVFQEGRTLREEYDYLSMIYFSPGDHLVPLSAGSYPLNLVERFEFGPSRTSAAPLGVGMVTVETQGDPPNRVEYAFAQDFDASGTTVSVTIEYLWVGLVDGKPEPETIVFDDPFLCKELYMLGKMQVGVRVEFLKFASVTYECLPLWKVEFLLEDGQSIRVYERWQQPMAGTGPANLVYAEVDLLEGQVSQSDYWHLVYSADHHNWNERYWILFDSLIGETYGVGAFAGEFGSNPEVYTLDANLLPLRRIGVRAVRKELSDHPPTPTPTPPPVRVDEWAVH